MYYIADIVGLRVASQRCRALAASSDDGFASLSYAQLAEELDSMIAMRETALAAERAARLDPGGSRLDQIADGRA
jgi:hypothetical protein